MASTLDAQMVGSLANNVASSAAQLFRDTYGDNVRQAVMANSRRAGRTSSMMSDFCELLQRRSTITGRMPDTVVVPPRQYEALLREASPHHPRDASGAFTLMGVRVVTHEPQYIIDETVSDEQIKNIIEEDDGYY